MMNLPSLPRYWLEKKLVDRLESIPSGGRCLNLGCGPHGRYHTLFSRWDVDGVDVADAEGVQPWKYHQLDAKRLPFKSETFDYVVSIEAFEHIDENTSAMSEAARVIKGDGILLVTVPTNFTWVFELGRHGPHYYTQNTLRQLAEDAGFVVTQIEPVGGGSCSLRILSNLGSPRLAVVFSDNDGGQLSTRL